MRSLSYKYKTWLLYLLFFLLGYMLYKKVFTTTIQLVRHADQLEEKVRAGNENNAQLELIKMELEDIGKISLHNDTMPDPAVTLLKFFSGNELDGSIEVNSFEPVSSYEIKNYRVHTFKVKLSGDYLSLLQAVNLMEQKVTVAKLVSGKFYTEHINNHIENQLYAELTLQYITAG